MSRSVRSSTTAVAPCSRKRVDRVRAGRDEQAAHARLARARRVARGVADDPCRARIDLAGAGEPSHREPDQLRPDVVVAAVRRPGEVEVDVELRRDELAARDRLDVPGDDGLHRATVAARFQRGAHAWEHDRGAPQLLRQLRVDASDLEEYRRDQLVRAVVLLERRQQLERDHRIGLAAEVHLAVARELPADDELQRGRRTHARRAQGRAGACRRCPRAASPRVHHRLGVSRRQPFCAALRCAALRLAPLAGSVAEMDVVIRGHDLPGRTFRHAGVPVHGVHVGVQVRSDPTDLVPGDAAAAEWRVDVRAVVGDDGELDFRGPAVHGSRGERFVYLTWGDVTVESRFTMFRRAKLMLGAIDPAVVRRALDDGRPLVATLALTDCYGGPVCGRVEPPAIVWTVG